MPKKLASILRITFHSIASIVILATVFRILSFLTFFIVWIPSIEPFMMTILILRLSINYLISLAAGGYFLVSYKKVAKPQYKRFVLSKKEQYFVFYVYLIIAAFYLTHLAPIETGILFEGLSS